MKNITKVKIVDYPEGWGVELGSPQSEKAKEIRLSRITKYIFRDASKLGDVENINNTQLGKLRDSGIQFEIIKESSMKTSELKILIKEEVKNIIQEDIDRKERLKKFEIHSKKASAELNASIKNIREKWL